jgi:hypothetical protein
VTETENRKLFLLWGGSVGQSAALSSLCVSPVCQCLIRSCPNLKASRMKQIFQLGGYLGLGGNCHMGCDGACNEGGVMCLLSHHLKDGLQWMHI